MWGYPGPARNRVFLDERNQIVCSPVRCENCGKTTWQGCGLHVDEALAGVAAADRCACPR